MGPQCPDVQSACYFKAGPGGTPLRFLIIPSAVLGAIPARAGFTGSLTTLTPRRSDHPRSRGVYAVSPSSQARRTGSSPLARGLQISAAPGFSFRGIIPARAGFTTPPSSASRATTDHPRSRGVYWPAALDAAGLVGSSPLARGLRHLRGGEEVRGRIIPARAGFTRPTDPSEAFRSGSSPLARGLHIDGDETVIGRGIIPARAGFTSHRHGRGRGQRDHPRSRGVYARRMSSQMVWTGSSPLARGLRRRRG